MPLPSVCLREWFYGCLFFDLCISNCVCVFVSGFVISPSLDMVFLREKKLVALLILPLLFYMTY